MSRPDEIDAFTALFVAYRPRLVALVRRFYRGAPDAVPDILQDVWIKGAKAWPPREVAHARSWLGRIAINEAIARNRKHWRHVGRTCATSDARPMDHRDREVPADEAVLHGQVRDAIAKLDARIPKQNASLKLVFLEGLTYTEAAKSLGIAEGTAKSNASKALVILRETLTLPKAA